MNYRFGFSLGKTAADGQIYGAASAAADCFKALVPFFFFAAIRNKMWSQALAAALVWTVVTSYSMTSALGHAALNRLDTTGQRAVASATYKDLRADAKRAQEQLTWVPAHRPADTVTAELNVLKAQRHWTTTKECNEIVGRSAREFCQQFHKLNAEFASAQEAQKLETRIAEVNGKLAQADGSTASSEADPQASVLAKLTGLEVETIQTALTIFVALLIEIGSGFGMYVAFAHWRLHDRAAPAGRIDSTREHAAPVVADAMPEEYWSTEPEQQEPKETAAAIDQSPINRSANDNRQPSSSKQGNGVPDSDVQRFYRQRIVASGGSSMTLQDLYHAYCAWCEDQEKEAFAMPTFSREFKSLGVRKEKMAGRIRYFDIALRSEQERLGDKKLPLHFPRAA
jgi:hypothetical protein